jgi:hypothetical protein
MALNVCFTVLRASVYRILILLTTALMKTCQVSSLLGYEFIVSSIEIVTEGSGPKTGEELLV